MKNAILFFSLLLISSWCMAQKNTIAITAFEKGSSNLDMQYVKAIENSVKEGFQRTNRFVIVDRTNMRKVKEEKELQKGEEFMDGSTVDQTSFEGAEQIVTGSITSVSIEMKTTEKSYYYVCKIAFSLQIIEISTGKIIANEMIVPKQSFGATLWNGTGGATEQEAFFIALKGMNRTIDKFVGRHFPMSTSILEITEAKNEKAKKVLINIGSDAGAKKNQIYSVYELTEMEVGGKMIERKREIGKLKILKIEGAELAMASVTKGGEEVQSLFTSGSELVCQSQN